MSPMLLHAMQWGTLCGLALTLCLIFRALSRSVDELLSTVEHLHETVNKTTTTYRRRSQR